MSAGRGSACGVAHPVTLPIVGSDAADFGYCFGKRAQEELVRDGDVPWAVVRATRFFEFPEPLLNSASPLVMVPRMPTRPVAAQDVAQTLVEHAVGGPAGMAPEIAGPDRLDMVDMGASHRACAGPTPPRRAGDAPGKGRRSHDHGRAAAARRIPTRPPDFRRPSRVPPGGLTPGQAAPLTGPCPGGAGR